MTHTHETPTNPEPIVLTHVLAAHLSMSDDRVMLTVVQPNGRFLDVVLMTTHPDAVVDALRDDITILTDPLPEL